MIQFSILIALFVASHVCLAQNGYNYQRPEGPSTVAPLRPGSQGTFGTSPAFPSPSSAFPTGSIGTTPSYASTGYPAAGRPAGASQFPLGPSTGGVNYPGQIDTSVTPSGPGFGSTQGIGAPGYGGSTASGRPGFTGRPGAPGAGPSGPAGPTGPAGQPTGFPTGPGVTGSARPGFPGTGPSTPTGPAGSGFPGARPGASFPGTTGPAGGQGGQFNGQQDDGSYDGGDYSAIPGEPGQDYPIYSEIPQTSFDCNQQQWPGYYADVEAQCQVFHICALNRTYDFLCPNGTIFSQEHLVCVWWNQFDCQSAPSLYGNNAYIYDYSQTGQQQANDFAGSQGQIGTVGIPAGQGAQGPSTTFPGSAQRPGGPASGGFTGRPTGPSTAYPGATGPQGPSAGFGGVTGPQGPSVNYGGATGPQGPSVSFPGSTGPQGPSGQAYPGAPGPQGPSGPAYPGAPGPQGPQGPAYPGAPGPQGPSGTYPGAAGPQAPSTAYPGATGAGPSYQGSTTASGFPGSAAPGGPATGGFPATSRPGFPAQDDSKFPSVTPQAPTREYLPPRRS